MAWSRFGLKGPFEHLRRYRHIMAVLAKYGFEEVADSLRSRLTIRWWRPRGLSLPVEPIAAGRSRPVRVRMALEELGPTFIKLGQLLSTRPDIVPGEYIEELEKLQDQVPPEDFGPIEAEIESQLGGSIDTLFKSFNRVPIAAGSIAQVHRAVTREGDHVVVKVRRPKIIEKIRTETKVLEDLTGLLKATLFENSSIDPQRVIREFCAAIMRETDLTNERYNQLRFIKSFADDPAIHIPKIYDRYCSDGVLTMEYIAGLKPTGAAGLMKAGLDPKIVARRGADFVLRQIFEFGFFHTDPHPGNFFLLPDNVLAPIDFGQVARLSERDLGLLSQIILAIVDGDATRIVQILGREDIIPEGTDSDTLAGDIDQMLQIYSGLPLKEIPFVRIVSKDFELMRRYNLRVPPQFTLMFKAMVTVESFGRMLDPDFEVIEHLKPYARRFRLRQADIGQILKNVKRTLASAKDVALNMPEDLRAVINKVRKGQFELRVHHEHLEDLTKTLDKSSNRVSFAVITAALLVGSSLLVSQQGKVLGFVRLQTLGVIGYFVAAMIGLWLLISIIRSRHL